MNAVVETASESAVPVTPDLIPPGIYFGMPEDQYHADPALGSTDLKEIVLDHVEYQYERLHGGEEKETMALKWGAAIHCRALEGRLQLAERFPIAPAVTDYPGALVTMEHLRKHCKQLGLRPGTKKEDAIAAIRDFDKDVLIWDEIIGKFTADNTGKTIIPRDALNKIEQAVQWMQQDRYLAPVMEDGTFTAGSSEVSIFYEDNGVRLKARIDHLLSHAVVDLKSFRPIMAERVKPAAKRAIYRMRYDLQAAAYIRALKFAAKLFAAGQVFNCSYDPAFLNAVFRALDISEKQPRHEDALKWIWVMIKASGAPQPIVAQFDVGSMIFRQAQTDIEDAINTYRTNIAKHGIDKDWTPENPVEIWGDTDFPTFAFN